MTNQLLLVTIGPVQDFIAAARRTRDLWAGSQLLSEMSRAAAEELQRPNHQATLIFPAQDDLTKHDVVNRIIAVLNGTSPGDVGKAVETAIRTRLHTLAQETLAHASGLQGNRLEMARQQVADLPEIYWVTVPFSEDKYAPARRHLEHALAARKYTRQFGQPAWSRPVPKSSIDGVRESVIAEEEYTAADATRTLFQKYRAGRAERLSGVDLLKRCYRLTDQLADFPSTSHFAALPLLARWAQASRDYRVAVKKYLEALRFLTVRPETINQRRFQHISLFVSDGVAYDASILFEERLSDLADAAELPGIRGALDEFYAATSPRRTDRGERPDPYYALLHADGDFMGQTLNRLAVNGTAAHRRFSLALDTFASAVRPIVESRQHRGALVYSGGDDVLAFLPLHTVLACAKALHDQFRDTFAEMRGELDIAPTLSVGIAICHHIEPLSDALNLVRNAEKAAKRVSGKNGLAITLSKRGSGDRTVSGSWDSTLYERLQRFIAAQRPSSATMHDEALPDGAAYDLLSLAKRLGPTGGLLAGPMQSEALRILARKRGQHGETAIPTKTLNYVRSALGVPDDPDTRNDEDRVALEDTRFQRTVEQIADELIISREIARACGPSGKHEGATP